MEAIWTNEVLPTQKQNRHIKSSEATSRRSHADQSGNRDDGRGQVKEGEDEEPINSQCGEQIGEVAGPQPQHFIPGTY